MRPLLVPRKKLWTPHERPSLQHQMLLGGAGGESYLVVDSADFDGTNDYLNLGEESASESKTGMFSCWFRLDGGDSGLQWFMYTIQTGVARGVTILRNTSNKIQFVAYNSSDTILINIGSTTSFTAGSAWHHLLMAWDTTVGNGCRMYVDDASETVGSSSANDFVFQTNNERFIGADSSGSSKFNGCLAEVWFAPGQFLDITTESNRRKFRTAGGKPVDLGSTGSTPTGTTPYEYHHLGDGESVANFALNRGTGTDFTVNGTLDTGSTSPSD